MNMPLPAAIGSFIGAFLGYPTLGYVAGMKLSGAVPPAYGTQRIGSGVIFNNVENFVGSTFPATGRPVDRAPRYRSTCRQCGGPNESATLACEWCKAPVA